MSEAKTYTKPRDPGPPPAGMVEDSREHRIYQALADFGIPSALIQETTGMKAKQVTAVATGKEPVPLECLAKVDKLWDALTTANVGGVSLFPTKDYLTIRVQLLMCYTLRRQQIELEELREQVAAS